MNPQKRSLLLHKKCFECIFKFAKHRSRLNVQGSYPTVDFLVIINEETGALLSFLAKCLQNSYSVFQWQYIFYSRVCWALSQCHNSLEPTYSVFHPLFFPFTLLHLPVFQTFPISFPLVFQIIRVCWMSLQFYWMCRIWNPESLHSSPRGTIKIRKIDIYCSTDNEWLKFRNLYSFHRHNSIVW